MEYLGQLAVDSLLLGGIYTLMVSGLALSFGITRIVNFAHGEAVMLGAYGAYWATVLLKLDPLVAMPALMIVAMGAGYVVFRLCFQRILTAPPESQILLTFGLALILQNVALISWTSDQRSANPPYVLSSFDIGDAVVSVARLIGFGTAAVLIAAMFLWLKYTELGRASRALVENRDAAGLMGINVRQMYAVVFGISTALGAATGAILCSLSAVTPFMGFNIVVKSFAIIVLGGLGNIVGSVVGAFVLAIAETSVAYYLPNGDGWAEAVAFIVLFVVLVVRPSGIFGQAVGT